MQKINNITSRNIPMEEKARMFDEMLDIIENVGWDAMAICLLRETINSRKEKTNEIRRIQASCCKSA